MASTTTSTTTSAVNTSDLSVFADPTFDAKAWINGACAGRTQEEPLDRFLAELEMRLQVGWLVCAGCWCLLCKEGACGCLLVEESVAAVMT